MINVWTKGRRCHLILCLAFKESHIKSETHVLLFPPMSRLCDKISFSTLKSLYLVHTFIIVSTCQPGTSYLTLSSFSWSIDLHVYIELFPSMSSYTKSNDISFLSSIVFLMKCYKSKGEITPSNIVQSYWRNNKIISIW
jgi:hypothetical protein